MVSRKKAQLGAFLMARWVLLMLILVAMLVVPIWLKRNSDDKQKERTKAEAKANNGVNATYEAAQTTSMSPMTTAAGDATNQPARPVGAGHGLTFAARAPSADDSPDAAYLNCKSEPVPTDKPYQNACNPYQGDTSCRVVLPVLCIKTADSIKDAQPTNAPAGAWASSTLGATAPVMGALLSSLDVAHARCEKELGEGYRMAGGFNNGGVDWAMAGRRGQGFMLGGSTRYWVAVTDQRANCWDSPP